MEISVRDQPMRQRYEAVHDGVVIGIADYIRTEDSVVFTHTEVKTAWEGRGVGGILVGGALDHVRGLGLLALPTCPFVQAWMQRHPEYADLDYRSAPRPDVLSQNAIADPARAKPPST